MSWWIRYVFYECASVITRVVVETWRLYFREVEVRRKLSKICFVCKNVGYIVRDCF